MVFICTIKGGNLIVAHPKVGNKYVRHDDCYELRVQYKGNIWYSAYIDLDDYERVSQHSWRTAHKKHKVYLITSAGISDRIYLHNFILDHNSVKGYKVDHINGNSLDNRKCNLRVVTRQENIINSNAKCTNKLGIRGVSADSAKNLYAVAFSYCSHRFYFKSWNTIEEATYCRQCAEEYFGVSIISRNALAEQYVKTLSSDEKLCIKQYVTNIIEESMVA